EAVQREQPSVAMRMHVDEPRGKHLALQVPLVRCSLIGKVSDGYNAIALDADIRHVTRLAAAIDHGRSAKYPVQHAFPLIASAKSFRGSRGLKYAFPQARPQESLARAHVRSLCHAVARC